MLLMFLYRFVWKMWQRSAGFTLWGSWWPQYSVCTPKNSSQLRLFASPVFIKHVWWGKETNHETKKHQLNILSGNKTKLSIKQTMSLSRETSSKCNNVIYNMTERLFQQVNMWKRYNNILSIIWIA